MKNKSKAFSFVEIIIVISIIALLSTIATPVYRYYQRMATAETVASQLRMIQSAMESYFIEKGVYPSDINNSGSGSTQMPNELAPFFSPGFSFAETPIGSGTYWSWSKSTKQVSIVSSIDLNVSIMGEIDRLIDGTIDFNSGNFKKSTEKIYTFSL